LDGIDVYILTVCSVAGGKVANSVHFCDLLSI